MGLRFYSRIPVPGLAHEVPLLRHMAPALGFVGLIIGILPGVLLAVLPYLGLPPMMTAGIAVGVYAILTGAMAEDALADSADGLFGGQSIVTRLAILQDSRHGTYGVLAIVLFVIIRVAALSAMVAAAPVVAALMWVGATMVARTTALWMTLALLPARQDGSGASVGSAGLLPFGAGLGITLVLAVLMTAPFAGWLGMGLCLIGLVLVTHGWTQLCRHLVGGHTGDLIGALQALLEITVLTIFVATAF